jgi:restriction endonuclease S subunit
MSHIAVIKAFDALRKREGNTVSFLKTVFFDKLRQKYPAKPLRGLLTESKGGSWGSEYFEGGINAKVLRSPDIRHGFIDFEKAEERCFSKKEIENFNLVDNDVVVIKSNGSLDLVGKSQVFKANPDFPHVVASNFLLVLRPNQTLIWPGYLDLFLKSPQALAWKFDAQKTTTGLRNLDTKGFLSIGIPLPSTLQEQQKLVEDFEALVRGEKPLESEFLFGAYELCQNLKGIDEEHDQQLAHLTQLRQALLREAMQGQLLPQDPTDEPADVLLKKLQAAKEATGKGGKGKAGALFADEAAAVEGPFELPESWVWCTLGKISDVVRGGSPRPAGDKTYYDGNIPFLKVADLTATDDMYVSTHTHTIKEAGLNKTRSVEADTLMLTNSGATLGIPKICTFPTTFNDGVAAFLNIDSKISKQYLYYFLKLKSSWFLEEASRGQGQPNLNIDIIKNVLLPLPPANEQRRIVAKLEQLTQHCDALEQRIRESRRLAEQLLQTALREALAPPADTEPAEEAELELAEAETSAAPKTKRGRPRRAAFTLENAPPDLFSAIQFDE